MSGRASKSSHVPGHTDAASERLPASISSSFLLDGGVADAFGPCAARPGRGAKRSRRAGSATLAACVLITLAACSDDYIPSGAVAPVTSGTAASPIEDADDDATPPSIELTPSDPSPPASTTTTTPPPPPSTIPLPPLATPNDETIAEVKAAMADLACDPLDSRSCLLPFPSNYFTSADDASDSGVRVNFIPAAMPANASGVEIDPTEWNRNDGFSPNTPLLTFVPGIDPAASNLPTWTNIEPSLAAESPVVLIDATTNERVPLWAETDAKAASDTDRLLTIRPAISLPYGHRFVVALRNLRDAAGNDIPASTVFRAYRDRIDVKELDARRGAMEDIFAVLAANDVERDDLYLAWDFTVASERNITERMTHIRDVTLDGLGDFTPEWTIKTITDNPEEDGSIARRIQGTYTVPNFLTGDGGPGNRFYLPPNVKAGPDWLPELNGVLQAPFTCNIPTSATTPGSGTIHLAQYGHGLLGSHEEVSAGNVRKMANEHNVLFCATKWAGMSQDDIGNAAATLGDFSKFVTMADRLQQGVLNQIVLGRMMLTEGLLDEPAFVDGIEGRIDRTRLDYDGNSQGGIMGLMLTAVSPDIESAVLGVPGMNYSLLLPRSVDFDQYEAIMRPAYPNDLDRMLIISLAQMLWDRGEGAGYAQTLETPVLLDVALGDHQVSEISALVLARTIGASFHEPWAAADRQAADTVTWGLDPIDSYPFDGSAIILWDSGSPTVPFDPVPPRDGIDPHEDPRADADVRRQKAEFLFADRLINVCGTSPCRADRAP